MSDNTMLKAALETCVKAKAACDESMRRVKAEKIKLAPDYSKLLKLADKNKDAFKKACKKLLPDWADADDDKSLTDVFTRQAHAWEQMGAISKENAIIPEPEEAAALPQKVRNAYRKSINYRRSCSKGIVHEVFSWIFTILTAVAVVFVVRTFLFEPIRVDGSSMSYTLANNEYLFCSKCDYLLGDVQRGDIVICHYWDTEKENYRENGALRTSPFLGIFKESTRFVKRVVGVPGDTIAVQNGVLYVNGQIAPTVNSQYQGSYNRLMGSDGQWHQEITLGENEYYVLGDNRGNSNDSHLIGPITRDMIIGHVQCVVYPFDKIRSVTDGADAWRALNPAE